MLSSSARNTQTNDELNATANQVGRKVRNLIDNASNEITNAAENVTTRIHEKPVQSSIIALGIGFLVGALLSRR